MIVAQRRLGRSALHVGPLMLGGNVFGWTVNGQAAFDILDRFVDAGLNAIDTADAYSTWVEGHAGGESEIVIGRWLESRGCRERIVLATKVGETMPGLGRGLSAARIVQGAEASLCRLRTDYLDLYQSHLDDEQTPLEETLEAYGRLVQAGKVRAIGASHYSPARLSKALETSQRLDLPRYDTLQPRYNLCDRVEVEAELQAACIASDVGLLCYSALAKGFLSGRYRSEAAKAKSVHAASLKAYGDERGLRILSALETVAAEQAASVAAVAVAWVLAQPAMAAAIVAVNSVAELDDLIGCVELELTSNQLLLLNHASSSEGRPA